MQVLEHRYLHYLGQDTPADCWLMWKSFGTTIKLRDFHSRTREWQVNSSSSSDHTDRTPLRPSNLWWPAEVAQLPESRQAFAMRTSQISKD